MLATFTVNDPGDFIDSDPNVTTLREAINAANALDDPDIIDFAPSLNGATINLTLGQLSITESVTIDATIDGDGLSEESLGITIDAGDGADHMPGTDDGFRIFDISGGLAANVEINGLTLTGGDSSGAGGAISTGTNLTLKNMVIQGNFATDGGGGGVWAELAEGYSLVITDSLIEDNHTLVGGDGGGILADLTLGGSAVVSNSQVRDNDAAVNGGGIAVHTSNVDDSGSFALCDSVITGNLAGTQATGADGGGVFVGYNSSGESVNIERNYIAGNTADSGGGISIRVQSIFGTGNGELKIAVRDSTIYDNTARGFGIFQPRGGGGISLLTDVLLYVPDIVNCTISGNRAKNGGGLNLQGNAQVRHSTIVNNEAGPQFESGNPQETGGGGVFIQPLIITQPLSPFVVPSFLNSIIAGNDHFPNEEPGGGYNPHNLTPDVGFWFGASTSGNYDWPSSYFPETGCTINDLPPDPITFDYTIVQNPAGPLVDIVVCGETAAHVVTVVGNDYEVLKGKDPKLGPLTNNGGFELPDGSTIPTHEPSPDSPAIDKGDMGAVAGQEDYPDFDQRGDPFTRTYNRLDIGAVEVQPPRIEDVLLYGEMPNGQDWLRDPYSYAQIVPTGKQLAPIFTHGVNTLQIVFTEPVSMPADGSALTLYGSNGVVFGTSDWDFDYDPDTFVATWEFNDPLPEDKYRLELSSLLVTHAAFPLDGEWDNLTGPQSNGTETPDNFDDDPQGRILLSGNGTAGGDFRFLFSLLPGDYNQDGVVLDSGPNSDLDLAYLADGDGDGEVDLDVNGDDGGVVTAHRLEYLPASKAGGDYMDDELVDAEPHGEIDYMVWRETFDSETDFRADGNRDNVIDAADYVIWSDHRLDYSAWIEETPFGGGSSGPYVQFGMAPQVINVTISGSESLHDPYSFENVVGSGEQLRTVPVGGADTISITFSEDVNVSAGSLDLVGLYTAYRPELMEFIYDLGTMTASWRFEFIEQGDLYLVSLSDAVTDVEGDHLDGEWVNPASLTTTNAAVSEFPSGDGEGGGDFNFVVALLPGDASLNLLVNGSDGMIIGPYYYMGQQGMEFVNGDFDGDGVVTWDDIQLLELNLGADLQNVWVLADLDGDFQVDQDDLDLLYENYDSGLENPTVEDGDLNGDGIINLDDVDLMFAQFGLELAVVS